LGDGVGAAVARALADDLDHPGLLQAGELGIDLAVARVPRRAERDVELLRELVARGGLHGEQAQDRVAEGHLTPSYCRT
jgi:hypothetical protein